MPNTKRYETTPCQHCRGVKVKGKTESWATYHARTCSTSCGAIQREARKRGADIPAINQILNMQWGGR